MDETTFNRIARGTEQRAKLRALLAGWAVTSTAYGLRGKAANYRQCYERSFDAMIERLHTAGYAVQMTPGPRGGKYAATYELRLADVVSHA